MTVVAPVKTRMSNKALWFDALDFELNVNDKVVVETARGLEIGKVADKLFKPTKKQLKALKSELKPIKRIAKELDIKREAHMVDMGEQAMNKFVELAAKNNKDMRPVSVEYLLDGKKAVFYFSADSRQDFRDLVKDLSKEFSVRVDMHQINDREKAAQLGGVGICGQELCCKRFGHCSKHVSIKMAKAQGMALNQENISGACNKLLCCLNYEYKMYEEFNKRAPKLKAKIDTPDGMAKVVEVNMPNETVDVYLEEEKKRVKISLDKMEIDKERRKREQGKNADKNKRPNKIGEKAWIEAQNKETEESLAFVYVSSNLKDTEKLATGVVTRLPSKRRSSKISSNVTINNKNSKKRRKRNKKTSRSYRKNSQYSKSNAHTKRRRTKKIDSKVK